MSNSRNAIIEDLHEIRNLEEYPGHAYEMANLKSFEVGLPYDIWLDPHGKNRNAQHNSPRLKVNVDGDAIPVSISDNPTILVKGKTIKKFSQVAQWIIKYLDVLLKHWNQEITDKQALALLDK